MDKVVPKHVDIAVTPNHVTISTALVSLVRLASRERDVQKVNHYLQSKLFFIRKNAIETFFNFIYAHFAECDMGYYGIGCLQECSTFCKTSRDCHHVTGYCKEGCKTGWQGTNCLEGKSFSDNNKITVLCTETFPLMFCRAPFILLVQLTNARTP